MTETRAQWDARQSDAEYQRIMRERTAGWLREHAATGGRHYGLTGPGSSAAQSCPRCNGGKS